SDTGSSSPATACRWSSGGAPAGSRSSTSGGRAERMRRNRPPAGGHDPQRRRRIAHVTFGLDVGGQEKLLVEFARHPDGGRFELEFLSIGARGVLAEDLEALGWPVTALGVPRGLQPRLVVQLARHFYRHRPAVVHTHDQRALFYAGPAAWLARVPRLVHTR